jgi:hypothetical protein
MHLSYKKQQQQHHVAMPSSLEITANIQYSYHQYQPAKPLPPSLPTALPTTRPIVVLQALEVLGITLHTAAPLTIKN